MLTATRRPVRPSRRPSWPRRSVSGGSLGEANHVGVHAKGDSGIGMPHAGGDDMNRDACEQQGRGVKVSDRVGVRAEAGSSGACRSLGVTFVLGIVSGIVVSAIG